MPSRSIPFVNGEYYHIFNRGVAHMQIYRNASDYKRFIKAMQYYQKAGIKPRYSFYDPKIHILDLNKNLVDIVCYTLMPNHFHFLLKQTEEGGITELVSKLTNSYTKYFNTKYKRVGPLVQGEFRAVYIQTNEQLIHLSRYIHLNSLVGFITKDLDLYPWSAYHEYINTIDTKICSKEIILAQFKSPEDYKKFVLDQEDYGKRLEAIKHQLLDYPQV